MDRCTGRYKERKTDRLIEIRSRTCSPLREGHQTPDESSWGSLVYLFDVFSWKMIQCRWLNGIEKQRSLSNLWEMRLFRKTISLGQNETAVVARRNCSPIPPYSTLSRPPVGSPAQSCNFSQDLTSMMNKQHKTGTRNNLSLPHHRF